MIETKAWNQTSLDLLPSFYIYSLLWKEIILDIDDDDTKAVKELIVYCRSQDIPESELNELQRQYHKKHLFGGEQRKCFSIACLTALYGHLAWKQR
ncbi:unnamed protein product [Rotaria socialis]|uniref:Uncharacterized protein n=1 Tax=Rotaria socialis TaxID=392032 RepID=A0A820W931_9BILA|nr:unnamed protein product [Rotaria socialis]CAF4764951.1 unnamed protein product [Rotaria socialis]